MRSTLALIFSTIAASLVPVSESAPLNNENILLEMQLSSKSNDSDVLQGFCSGDEYGEFCHPFYIASKLICLEGKSNGVLVPLEHGRFCTSIGKVNANYTGSVPYDPKKICSDFRGTTCLHNRIGSSNILSCIDGPIFGKEIVCPDGTRCESLSPETAVCMEIGSSLDANVDANDDQTKDEVESAESINISDIVATKSAREENIKEVFVTNTSTEVVTAHLFETIVVIDHMNQGDHNAFVVKTMVVPDPGTTTTRFIPVPASTVTVNVADEAATVTANAADDETSL